MASKDLFLLILSGIFCNAALLKKPLQCKTYNTHNFDLYFILCLLCELQFFLYYFFFIKKKYFQIITLISTFVKISQKILNVYFLTNYINKNISFFILFSKYENLFLFYGLHYNFFSI